MNDLTTVLRQRILIVYTDIEWRDEMFSKILNIYPHDMINKMIKSRCNCWIELVDGTTIRFAYASDSARRQIRLSFNLILAKHSQISY